MAAEGFSRFARLTYCFSSIVEARIPWPERRKGTREPGNSCSDAGIATPRGLSSCDHARSHGSRSDVSRARALMRCSGARGHPPRTVRQGPDAGRCGAMCCSSRFQSPGRESPSRRREGRPLGPMAAKGGAGFVLGSCGSAFREREAESLRLEFLPRSEEMSSSQPRSWPMGGEQRPEVTRQRLEVGGQRGLGNRIRKDQPWHDVAA